MDNSNENGIWAQDLSGELKLIARTGDQLDVDDGPGTDFRTISDLSFIGGVGAEDYVERSGFNDQGQLAFSATFTDGSSGVFVSNLVAVPEPGSLLLASLACIGTLFWWKR